MANFFLFWYDVLSRSRSLTYVLIISTFALLASQATHLQLKEDISQMLATGEESRSAFTALENAAFSNRIMVLLSDKDTSSAADRTDLVQKGDAFIERLTNTFPTGIKSLHYITPDSVLGELFNITEAHLPIFLDSSDYSRINSILTPAGIEQIVGRNRLTLMTPIGFALQGRIRSDVLGLDYIALGKFQKFAKDKEFELHSGRLLSKTGHELLLYFTPNIPSKETDQLVQFFDSLDTVVKDFEDLYPDAQVYYFGPPAVAAGNAKAIRSDIKLTVSLTVFLLLIIFLWYFRHWSAPLLIFVPTLFGLVFALAGMSLLKGSISVIALGSGSLILGIAVNYSLHFLTHQKHHRDLRDTIRELAFPMIAGGLTTIAGFLCLLFVNAPVLQDLGLFAALSLTGASLSTLLFLPHLVSPGINYKTIELTTRDPAALFTAKTGRIAGWVILLVTPVMFYFATKVEFESDMNAINFMSADLAYSRKQIDRLTEGYDKILYINSTGVNLEQALEKMESIGGQIETWTQDSLILSATLATGILPSQREQERRITRWKSYWSDEKVARTIDMLKNATSNSDLDQESITAFTDKISTDYSPLTPERSTFLRKTFLDQLISEQDGTWQITGLLNTHRNKTDTLYSLIETSQEVIPFDRQRLTEKLVGAVTNDFGFITFWTSLLVFISLLIIYGRIELAIISFWPMAISWIWILGLMTLFDIKFNVINIVLSTLIFALGDDYCIFTTDRLQKKYAFKTIQVDSTFYSITLSAVTTIVGMGVLFFADHPALRSIAFVAIIGISAVWLKSQVVLPGMFNWLITKPTQQKHEPYNFINLILSIFSFGYFFFGSIILSMIGFILVHILPGNLKKRKYLFHILLSAFVKSLVYVMFNVKKHIIDLPSNQFDKPSILIANHSSVLDILALIMLNPKVILITNKWVWHSPVFGWLVRMVDYQYLAEGIDSSINSIRDRIQEGYSIVIFPEGTRSKDGQIGRFHKGAFYLAEQLNLDIQPVLIHGSNDLVTKGHFYLKNGPLMLKFLTRITADDSSFGTTYSERTKSISSWFKKEYQTLKQQIESPTYFSRKLYSNYLFKGPVLEWYMRIKVGLEGKYEHFHKLIPSKATIVDVGCGYGFLSYMLGYTSTERQIIGIDYDQDKIGVAENGYAKPENVHFIFSDIRTYTLPHADVFILNDVLHYLLPDDQEQLLQNCINNLKPKGQIIVRDGIRELTKKHWWTSLSEIFSTKILKFNKKMNHSLHFITEEWLRSIAVKNGFDLKITEASNVTSNHVFLLKKPGP